MWSELRPRWSEWSARPALGSESGAELTYGQLDATVGAAAARLSAAGVGPGRTVGVVLPSRPDLVISVLAALHCGARVVLANSRWWPRELRAVVEAARPGLVLITGAHRAVLEGLAPIAVLPDDGRHGGWADGVDLPPWAPARPARERDGDGPGDDDGGRGGNDGPGDDEGGDGGGGGPGDDGAGGGQGGRFVVGWGSPGSSPALVGFTTGGWREPRPVTFPVDLLVERWCPADTERPTATLVAGEAATVAGLAVVLGTLASGGRAVLGEHDGPGRLIRRLTEGGFERLWGTGPQLNRLAARLHPDRPLAPLSRVETTGGALHPPAAARLGSVLGADIATTLTLTEAAGVVTAQAPRAAAAHRTLDVGFPVAGVTISLVRSDGTPVAVDEVGDLLVQLTAPPPGVPPGDRLAAGTVATGDLACRLPNRSLRFQGRAADRFTCGEATVWPAQVEAALGTHPGLVDVAIVPRPHPELGMVPVAVTVPLDPERPPFLTDLAPLLADLPPAWWPQAQAVVDRLPLTASGQIHRRLLAYDEVAR